MYQEDLQGALRHVPYFSKQARKYRKLVKTKILFDRCITRIGTFIWIEFFFLRDLDLGPINKTFLNNILSKLFKFLSFKKKKGVFILITALAENIYIVFKFLIQKTNFLFVNIFKSMFSDSYINSEAAAKRTLMED